MNAERDCFVLYCLFFRPKKSADCALLFAAFSQIFYCRALRINMRACEIAEACFHLCVVVVCWCPLLYVHSEGYGKSTYKPSQDAGQNLSLFTSEGLEGGKLCWRFHGIL